VSNCPSFAAVMSGVFSSKSLVSTLWVGVGWGVDVDVVTSPSWEVTLSIVGVAFDGIASEDIGEVANPALRCSSNSLL